MTRLQILEKQNKDLRIRLENRQGKSELALCAVLDEIKELKSQLNYKDKIIAMLKEGLSATTAENESLRQQIETLRGENDTLRKTLEKAEDRAAKLETMLKKNSSNSDKPPSSDSIFNKAKANSEKEKSGKKVGGQLGHKGHRLLPSPAPDAIVEKLPSAICPCCGGDIVLSKSHEARQVVDFEVVVTFTEERSRKGQCAGCGKILQGGFSEGFYSHVNYGPNVKAAVAMLNADANVPINKTARFLSCLTEGRINMSDASVVNITSELAKRFDPAVREIVLALASCGVLNVDETGIRLNGDLTWMQIISNENFSLYGRSPKRGAPNDVMDSLIMLFTGVLVHDHLKSYYRYTHISHAECNTHVLRYLKAVTEIMKHPWAKAMAGLLREANKRKKELLEGGSTSMLGDELAKIREKYVSILKQGQAEYAEATDGKRDITYYVEERRLLKRLNKYIDEHLRFLADFNVPFTNNGAEHGARHVKGRLKTAGCFRSDGGVDSYAVVASVIATLRKQRMPIFSAIRDAFRGVPPTFNKPLALDFG